MTSRNLMRFTGAALLFLLVLEVGARVWAGSVLNKAPLFRLDRELGWVSTQIPKKSNTVDDTVTPKFVIIGDSFVFGEGVRPEQRFDVRMAKDVHPGRILNLGVSGYSTDQEFLSAEKVLATLKKGDVLVLLTFGDDFKGLLRENFAGRPKPRYLVESGQLKLIPPVIRWTDTARDRSYLFRILHKWVARQKAEPAPLKFKDLDVAEDIYHKLLLQHVVAAFEKGVKIVLAFHGQEVIDADFEPSAGQRVEYNIRRISQQYGFTYLNLDPELGHAAYRQRDNIHWNGEGHQKFADILMHACGYPNNRIHLEQKGET